MREHQALFCNLNQSVFLSSMGFLFLETAFLILTQSQIQIFASSSKPDFICHPICSHQPIKQQSIQVIPQFIIHFSKIMLPSLKFFRRHQFILVSFSLFLVFGKFQYNAISTVNKSSDSLDHIIFIYLFDASTTQQLFWNFIQLCSNQFSSCSLYYLIWSLYQLNQTFSYLRQLYFFKQPERQAFRQLLEQFGSMIIWIIIVRNQLLFQRLWNLDFSPIEILVKGELFFFARWDPSSQYFQTKQMNTGSIKVKKLFSLLTKVPKTVQTVSEPKSWLSKLFTKNENSVTFVLLQELFEYLQGTSLIHKQFPYLDNTERFRQNSMALHVHLLRDRMKQQTSLPRSELQKFVYNLQSTFFPAFAPFANPAIPTKNFALFYAEAYLNKLEMFSEMIKDHEWALSPNKQFLQFEQYAPLFRKLLYENRVEVDHVQLLKFCKYYLAHKKYLSMLDWNDVVQYKVKWGLESLKFINEVDKEQKKK